jgi:hypothetical protein
MELIVFERAEMVSKSDFMDQMVANGRFMSSKGLREFFYEQFMA